jgi:outer membrane protein OmpA-like peptidoglycan-associated protein
MKRILFATAAACLLFAPFSAGAQNGPPAAPETPAQTTTTVRLAEPAAPPAEPAAPSAAPVAPAAPSAAAPALPQQQTAQACQARTATVFFDSNSVSLNAESREAVAQTASGVTPCRVQQVVVTGHADATGDAQYNQALSERRSAAVRDILVAEGVPADAIRIEAQGEAAASGDASRDRRVDVQIQLATASL